jgi:hypothetical protein
MLRKRKAVLEEELWEREPPQPNNDDEEVDDKGAPLTGRKRGREAIPDCWTRLLRVQDDMPNVIQLHAVGVDI